MTSFKYMGEFKDEESLPTRIQEGAVQFKEPDMKKFSIISGVLSLGILVLFCILAFLIGGSNYNVWGPIVAILLIVPHEFLHAIWMKGDVFMYTSLKKGMAFVVSNEDHTKARFVWLSLFPTIVFGFIPFLIFVCNPSWSFLGYLGAFSISMGAGDFCNVYFALTQMPKNSVTFLSGFHSYWYIPKE